MTHGLFRNVLFFPKYRDFPRIFLLLPLCVCVFLLAILISLHIFWNSFIRGINGCGWLFDSFIILKYLSLIIYFVLSSTLSDINITNITFFWLLILWYIFPHSFTCNLFVSLKGISYRQHATESYFFVHPNKVYFLTGMLIPFPFNIIVDMVRFEFFILIFVPSVL